MLDSCDFHAPGLLPGGLPRRFTTVIHFCGRPRRLPWPAARRSRIRIASASWSRSARSSATIFWISMLPGSPILSQHGPRLPSPIQIPLHGRPTAKLSSYSFPTLMPMELVTADSDRKLRNAYIQLTGTDPGGDCSDSYLQNCSQVRDKQIRRASQGRADLWKRLLHPLWRGAGE